MVPPCHLPASVTRGSTTHWLLPQACRQCWCLLPSAGRHSKVTLHPYWEIPSGLGKKKYRLGLKRWLFTGKARAWLPPPASAGGDKPRDGAGGSEKLGEMEVVPLQPNSHLCSSHLQSLPPLAYFPALVRSSGPRVKLWPSPFPSPFRLQIK